MGEFQKSFQPFDTLGEHAEHIAWLVATGVIDPVYDPSIGGEQFVEGYGRIADFVVRASNTDTDVSTISESEVA